MNREIKQINNKKKITKSFLIKIKKGDSCCMIYIYEFFISGICMHMASIAFIHFEAWLF